MLASPLARKMLAGQSSLRRTVADLRSGRQPRQYIDMSIATEYVLVRISKPVKYYMQSPSGSSELAPES